MLVPVETAGGSVRLSHKEIVEGLHELRKQVKAEGMSVREMVEEGRRF